MSRILENDVVFDSVMAVVEFIHESADVLVLIGYTLLML